MEDKETETYREKKNDQEKKEDFERKKTRAERIEEERIADSIYRGKIFRFFLTLTPLFFLLFTTFQRDETVINNWMFLLLPFAFLLEAVFQKIHEFHFFFGILLCFFFVFSVSSCGLSFIHVVLLLCMLSGKSILTSASAVASGLWILANNLTLLQNFAFFKEKDLGWLLLSITLLVVYRFFVLQNRMKKMTRAGSFLSDIFFEYVFFLMIPLGLLFLILQHFSIIQLPEIIRKMHFVRTGIISCILLFLGLYDDDENSNEIETKEKDGKSCDGESLDE